MVINDLKSAMGQKKQVGGNDQGGEEDLYNLVRGKKSSLTIQSLDEDSDEYVPSRKVIMMISSDESDGEDYSPRRPDETEMPVADFQMESEVDRNDERKEMSSDNETSDSSSTGKYESSSVVPTTNNRFQGSPRAILKSPKGSPRPIPPEAFNLIYKRAQERNEDLSHVLAEKMEQQNKYLESMN